MDEKSLRICAGIFFGTSGMICDWDESSQRVVMERNRIVEGKGVAARLGLKEVVDGS